MTLQTALDQADQMKPNMMDRQLKIAFLTEIEQLWYTEIMMNHEHDELGEIPVYTEDTDPGTELLVPDPYSNFYKYWLMMKIDEQTLEMDKQNNDAALFEQWWGTASDWYTRHHMPITRAPYFRM